MNTGEAHNGSEQYQEIATKWEAAVEIFANRIHQSSSAAWDGNAANSAREAISKYAQQALDLSAPLKELADRVTTTVNGINDTRNAVQKPPDGGHAYNPLSWNLGFWHGPNSAAVRNDCQNAAREAMKNHYVTPFTETDMQIPVLPVPNSPTDPLYTAPKEPSSVVQPGSGGPNSSTPSTSTSADTNHDSSNPTDNSQQQSTTPSNTDASATPSSSSATSPTSTTPASTGIDPTSATTPSSYSGGSGLGGSGLGGLGGTTDSGGGQGRSVPGTSAGTGTNAAAANAARASSTASGLGGMGGMGGGAGKKDEDKDHQTPEWLKNMENTEELLGPEIKHLPDGVIGKNPGE
ncbi:hypothetical protein [Nocardia miyunensis]|uniref:hypothetical protein n=1 Tax=Nocardia miyunensis TaxID=282684 RepID=UPI0012F4DD7C|nr:hypothetical protein [Nocardia miyunensis]